MPYDLTYKRNPINKTNNKQNRTRDTEIKTVVTRREDKRDNGENRGRAIKEHV